MGQQGDDTGRRGPGRPSKFDPQTAGQLIRKLKRGAHRKVAAKQLGIGESTLRDWMRSGKDDPEGIFGDFRRSVLEAESAAENRLAQRAYLMSLQDPSYALKYLAIRWRKRWNPRHQRVRVKHEPTAADLEAATASTDLTSEIQFARARLSAIRRMVTSGGTIESALSKLVEAQHAMRPTSEIAGNFKVRIEMVPPEGFDPNAVPDLEASPEVAEVPLADEQAPVERKTKRGHSILDELEDE
jgi:hypothetical protein